MFTYLHIHNMIFYSIHELRTSLIAPSKIVLVDKYIFSFPKHNESTKKWVSSESFFIQRIKHIQWTIKGGKKLDESFWWFNPFQVDWTVSNHIQKNSMFRMFSLWHNWFFRIRIRNLWMYNEKKIPCLSENYTYLSVCSTTRFDNQKDTEIAISREMCISSRINDLFQAALLLAMYLYGPADSSFFSLVYSCICACMYMIARLPLFSALCEECPDFSTS